MGHFCRALKFKGNLATNERKSDAQLQEKLSDVLDEPSQTA